MKNTKEILDFLNNELEYYDALCDESLKGEHFEDYNRFWSVRQKVKDVALFIDERFFILRNDRYGD